MKLHRSQTEFNCGIDLHTTSMYVCVMKRDGTILVHKKVAGNDTGYLLKLLQPYRHDLTVACESTPNWYFLYDLCQDEKIGFVLGHALYMTAISKAKVKNDKVDSMQIANLLRSNMLPEAYTCPREYRVARDLMRRRRSLVGKRTDLKNSLAMSIHMHNLPPLAPNEKNAPLKRRAAYRGRAGGDELLDQCYEHYLSIIEEFDRGIRGFEKLVEKYASNHQPEQVRALRSCPGMGRIAALTIIYESGDVNRFSGAKHYCSYARVACNEGMSNDKSYGSRGRKQGNRNLKWIFGQACIHAANKDEDIRRYRDHLRKRHGKNKARNILSHRLAKFAYLALKDGRNFDINIFLNGREGLILKD